MQATPVAVREARDANPRESGLGLSDHAIADDETNRR